MPHKNPVERRAYMRAWKLKNAERHRYNNKLADAAIHANKRAAKYGATGRIDVAVVRQVLSAAVCYYCGGSNGWIGLDHVVPLHAGGSNSISNLVAACHSCNASKFRGDRPGRWAREFEFCVECGTSERKHSSRGRCLSCDSRFRSRLRRSRAA